ncbi:MAG TPA: sialidase family protein [Steroidobacteraceae bacterium]
MPPPPYSSVMLVQLSKASAFVAGCDGVAANGTLYVDTAAEPSFVVNPGNPLNLIAGWQQNRWSNGGAQGLSLAASVDGGTTWTSSSAAFSRCTGAASGSAGDYARATDVWLTASPSGAVYALALSFTGGTLLPGSSSAMLVAQSQDGGRSWSAPVALIRDGEQFFNDKGSITADSTDSNYVYAVWDRLNGPSAGPAYFAVTADAGVTWAAGRSIYDPGAASQTLGNQIVVLPGDVVLDVFTEIDNAGVQTTALARLVRSLDHGATWSAPITIAEVAPLGTVDPRTGKAVRDGSDIVSVSMAPGGAVYVAWQDARFSGGARDGIALTHSSDGGTTWATPLEVNADPAVQAFTPTVHVGASGVIAVSYYDLRDDAFAPFGSLLADAWMVTSSDGTSFQEKHLSGPFDMDLAPDSGGLFVGDYEALSSATGFLPLYVQTDPGAEVRSDAFMAFPSVTASAHVAIARAVGAFQAPAAPAGLALAPSARQLIARRMEARRLERRREP